MKNCFRPSLLFCLVLFAASPGLQADVKMPAIFSDHMVLQQEIKIPVWGWALPQEKVTVTLGAETAVTVADPQGKWRVDLPPLPNGAPPQVLKIVGNNIIQFQDVLIGDVWLCSGQSNMQFGLRLDQNGNAEMAKADEPQIRLFYVTMKPYLHPQSDLVPWAKAVLECRWQVCTPATVGHDGDWGGFSAIAYYFGRKIHQVTGHPVGLIASYWGGTPAESWTSLEALQKSPVLAHFAGGYQQKAAKFTQPGVKYKDLPDEYLGEMDQWNQEVVAPYRAAMAQWELQAEEDKALGTPPPPKPQPSRGQPVGPERTPTALFNGMIAPLIPYALKGVIWYQGESNEGDGIEYGTLFRAMITDWRERWQQGNFPFLFVQLAKYRQPASKPSEGWWPWVRDGQVKALSLPNTGMAVAIDIGDPNNIHPADKSDVAARLALAARHVAYGENLVYSGPMYDSMKIEGGQIRITFKQTGGGLTIGVPPWTWDGKPVPPPTALTGFAIAGADKKWFWAWAFIQGDSVVVASSQVPAPVAVRYGWADNPPCNLYNREQLPASPFRTDDWPN